MRLTQSKYVYSLKKSDRNERLAQLVPESVARECLAVPLRIEDGDLVIASANPDNPNSIRKLSMATRRNIKTLPVVYTDVRAALNLVYGKPAPEIDESVTEALCLRLGFIHPDHLPVIHEKCEKLKISFLESCERLGLIEKENIIEIKGLIHHLPYLRNKTVNGLDDLSELIPWDIAENLKIAPLGWVGNHLLVGSLTVYPAIQILELQRQLRIPIQMVLIAQETLERLQRRFYLRGAIQEDQDIEVAKKLVQQNILTQDTYDRVHNLHLQTGKNIEDSLLELGLIERTIWFNAKAKYYRVEYHDLERDYPENIDSFLGAHSEKYSPNLMRALRFLPLSRSKDHYEIGMVEPSLKRIRLLENILGCAINPRLLDKEQLNAFFSTHLHEKENGYEIAHPPIEDYAVSLRLITPLLLESQAEPYYGIGDDRHPLVRAGLMDDVDYAELQSLRFNIPFTRLERTIFNENHLNDLPRDLMIDYHCIPLLFTDKQVWLAVSNPLNGDMFAEVEKTTGKQVWPVLVPESILQSVIDRYLLPQKKKADQVEINIIEKLVENGLITQMDASRILGVYAIQDKPLDVVICEQTFLTPEKIVPIIAKILGVPTISLALQEKKTTIISPLGEQTKRLIITDPVSLTTANRISLELAEKWQAIPVSETEKQVIVAFANLDFQPGLLALQAMIEKQIRPVLVSRHELTEAIQRVLGRRNLGTYLLMEGLITRAQLNRALDLAKRTGVRVGRAMLSLRYVTQKQLYQFIAAQSHLPFVDLQETEIDETTARMIPEEMARENGMLPIQQTEERVTLAITDPLDESVLSTAKGLLKRPVEPVIVSESDLDLALEKIYSRDYLEKSVSELLVRTPDDSAYRVISRGQQIFFIGFLIFSAIWIIINYTSYFLVVNTLAMVFYMVYSGFKLFLIYKALDEDLEVPVSQEDIENLDDRDLPVFSILVPVYKEAEILADLLEALKRLDYPTTKLDILILMEEDDQATVKAFYDWNPPSHFRGLVVPTAQPKTKPKACNYGLIHARGEYVVIFDAEDLPDPNQLKKVVVGFSKLPPEYACIQSKLNYYNRDQNLLTRWFTIEYSMWFDLFLPGLNSSKSPIPLGGTSNHFKRSALLEIGAWDPYNVTEDADLGIRLYKRGYKTAIVDSTTYEEANSKLGNWIRQRSRWIKGYIQTWLVHMRHPIRLWKEIGWKAFWGYQFVVGGNFISALLNPIYWVFTTVWFIFQWQFIQQIFPSAVFYFGALCLFFGNFAFTYINVAGAMRRNYYGMVKYALLSPFYWALASLAAWKGFLQLFRNPHYWEKTIHGLSSKTPVVENNEATPEQKK
ncbi:MAG TPA: glycosyltransferase family 2 protein [Anaerolineaceae bacterium]|nr:glycosyltransferase family 2 protein [Anaerolineaceae bacterium]HPN50907.1 glycosyltransferase family 2 protein [Anaerolineaceae bacterium]